MSTTHTASVGHGSQTRQEPLSSHHRPTSKKKSKGHLEIESDSESIPNSSLSSTLSIVSHVDVETPENENRTDGAPSPLTVRERRVTLPSASQKEALPKYLLLRYRMGYTTFKLSERQRAGYSWNDLEDFIMYKEHKYNSINILSRFVTFLLLCLSITIFCHAFSVSSTEWRAVRYVDYYQSIGLFVKCTETSYKQCNIRTSTNFERQLADAVTGQILCYADNSANSRTVKFVQKYIGAMWSLEILNLLFDAVVFVLLVVMSYRPTRSHILALILFLLLLNTVCGIVVCVLFPIYTRCEGKTCQARQGLPTASQKGVTCSVSFLWGYKLYIGVTVLHFLCFIISFCMHNAILNIRTNTRRRLRKERKRRRKLKRLSGANYVLREAASPEDLALQNSLPSTVTVLPSSPEYEAARERYLTARELGVRIPGADDWLYDERSDMYYSFGQNCFWDPLTSEYYNCTLGSWQEEIQHIVEVRDVLEYTTQIPPGGGDDEEEELQSLQEEPTSEEKTK